MSENLIPLTGYTICYGPLVLVILGLITAAALGDNHARRTYLRRRDLRPELERSGSELSMLTPYRRVETPSGGVVSIEAGDGVQVRTKAAKPMRSTATAAKATRSTATTKSKSTTTSTAYVGPSDDLTKVKGIGPVINRALNGAGIFTFGQLADTPVERLSEILESAEISNFNEPDTWPQQARLAADGAWSALETLQNKL